MSTKRNDEAMTPDGQPFPAGCTIKNIRRGYGIRSKVVYADLYDPEGRLLISGTLKYINEQLLMFGTATQP